MPYFVVEESAAGLGSRELDDVVDRAQAAAEGMAAEHVLVRFVRSVFVPEDELCLHLFEAPSSDAATAVARRAGIVSQRVLVATTTVPRR